MAVHNQENTGKNLRTPRAYFTNGPNAAPSVYSTHLNSTLGEAADRIDVQQR